MVKKIQKIKLTKARAMNLYACGFGNVISYGGVATYKQGSELNPVWNCDCGCEFKKYWSVKND